MGVTLPPIPPAIAPNPRYNTGVIAIAKSRPLPCPKTYRKAVIVELSLKCEYALLALLELAQGFATESPLQIRHIAKQQNIPDRYLEQLLATLRRHGLVRSQRGSKGGYLLAKDPWQISVLDVVRCIEGNEFDPTSEASHTVAPPRVAVVRELWQVAQEAAEGVLARCTLKDLCERERQRQLSTTMYYI